MKLTLFLGAGFSAPFGHPVMESFLAFADTCRGIDDDDRAFLAKLVIDARRANSFLESSPTNIEDILSFSQMGERLRLTSDEEPRPEARLRSILQRIYTQAPLAEDYWERYECLERLVGSKLEGFPGGLALVTTNYDVNAESACYTLGVQVDPGFQFIRPQQEPGGTVGQCYAEGGTPLYKLHGSVNWYRCDDDPGIEVEDRVVSVQGLPSGSYPQLPRVCARNYEPPSPPIIVPPSFLKPDLPAALRLVWQGAANALSKSSIVAFIGYSFPPSDTEMSYFLARSFMDNPGLRAVYVVDPRANDIVDRLQSSTSKMGSHFRNFLRPLEGDWREVTLPL